DLDAAARATAEEVLERLASSAAGLSAEEAARRLGRFGPNALSRPRGAALRILLRQLRNPLLGLLLVATAVSFGVGDRTDADIILAIMTLSVLVGFFDEYRADRAVQALEAHLAPTTRVLRDGQAQRIPAEAVVPGDILLVEVGDILP